MRPAGVLAVRSRFTPEAGRVRHVPLRKRGPVEDLVPVDVGDRHFRGRDEEEVVRRQTVQVVLELGELPRARGGGAIHQIGRRDLLVAVLPRVQIDHERGQRADQSRPKALQAFTIYFEGRLPA